MTTTAYDLAPAADSPYVFSMDNAKVAAALRSLADEIDAGNILPQRATFRTDAGKDDYPISHVYMRFYDKR